MKELPDGNLTPDRIQVAEKSQHEVVAAALQSAGMAGLKGDHLDAPWIAIRIIALRQWE